MSYFRIFLLSNFDFFPFEVIAQILLLIHLDFSLKFKCYILTNIRLEIVIIKTLRPKYYKNLQY